MTTLGQRCIRHFIAMWAVVDAEIVRVSGSSEFIGIDVSNGKSFLEIGCL